MANYPNAIGDVEQLEELFSKPTPGAIQALGALEGDIVVLGVGGKMGPTLARMAKRASEQAGVKRRVIGVARFSSVALEQQLQSLGRRDGALRSAGRLHRCANYLTRPT